MNIILFEKKELSPENRLLLTDHRAKHIVKVLQSEPGDTIRIGEINGDIGQGKVDTIARKYPFRVELAVTLSHSPASSQGIDLLLALPRPIMLKRILSQVTALGVDRIFLINAKRVEKSFWDAGILKEEEYRPHLIHGLEQAVDTRLPQITMHRYFQQFAEDVLPSIRNEYGSMIIAHPGAENSLSHCFKNTNGRVLFAIGPEGGWVDFEIETLLAAGLQDFNIGPRILKVDTAVVSIHGRIRQALDY